MPSIRNIVVLACIAPALVAAEPPAASRALAGELMRLLRMEENFQAFLTQCSKPEGSPFDPMVTFRADPDSFGGISPQSSYWPEVQAVYVKFQQRACAYATPSKFAAYFADHLAKEVPEADLRTAVEFQRTAAAQRVQSAISEANNGFQAFATKLMYEAYEAANEEFSRGIRQLRLKYQANPK